jgi:hypothetical protein
MERLFGKHPDTSINFHARFRYYNRCHRPIDKTFFYDLKKHRFNFIDENDYTIKWIRE